MRLDTKFVRIRMIELEIGGPGELAELLEVSRSSVSAMLHNKQQPTLETISKLCKILECTPNDLLTAEEPAKGPGRPKIGALVGEMAR